jgi:arylsulfatase A-like enzyme
MPEDPLAAGLSLASVLTGKPGTGHEAVLVCHEYGGVRGVRTGDWKFVSRARGGPQELYDLRSDPDERTDLTDEPAYRGRKSELDAVLHDWFAAHVDRARDGFSRPVSGRGQLQPVTFGADDASAYYQGEEERRVAGDAETPAKTAVSHD